MDQITEIGLRTLIPFSWGHDIGMDIYACSAKEIIVYLRNVFSDKNESRLRIWNMKAQRT